MSGDGVVLFNQSRYDSNLQKRFSDRYSALGNNKWKLFIDRRYHNHSNGRLVFDFPRRPNCPGEIGYIDAMEKAFENEVKDSIGKPLTIHMIERFHEAATKDVRFFFSRPTDVNLDELNNRLRDSKIIQYVSKNKSTMFRLLFGDYKRHSFSFFKNGENPSNLVSATEEGLKEIFALIDEKKILKILVTTPL